ncbi:hypothetical protein [Candidatus Protochlamydia amoebophila]|uniref:Uncharacterized protein n=1 Tax=Protochlamydia amoebophila (strain UWE25) TaxID=264201 RepID=A0A2P9H9A6_PARUW|nr:hypothetical protein [Candidatus Protochlamydia amoebophila]SPJ31566.1 unnamed protein product [Candidatus Protochlamydia amoebophila UWE25]
MALPDKSKSKKKESTLFGLENKSSPLTELDQFDPDKMTLSDVENMISKVKILHDEIDRKLDDIFQKSGWTSKQIKTYLDNPNNFTVDEWEKVQRDRQKLMNTLKTGKDLQAASISNAKTEQNSKLTRERRGKTIGARRNWISMQ